MERYKRLEESEIKIGNKIFIYDVNSLKNQVQKSIPKYKKTWPKYSDKDLEGLALKAIVTDELKKQLGYKISREIPIKILAPIIRKIGRETNLYILPDFE